MTVVPVLGLLSSKEAFNPTPNAAEVDAIFDVPLEMFLKVYKFHSSFFVVSLTVLN